MKKQTGFTIVELMVIVGIIAMLLVLIFANFNETRAAARDRVRVAHIDQIRLALEEYKARCNEYPARLDLGADNGDCPDGFTLGSVLGELPVNPGYSEEPVYYSDSVYSEGDSFNGYLYAGLSTRSNGPCFEYHLGVPIESGREDDTYTVGDFLKDDHDCAEIALNDRFDNLCALSVSDFDRAEDDVRYGVYDFRSANNCS
jgi:type II secretory pathway pseudopilin PulG